MNIYIVESTEAVTMNTSLKGVYLHREEAIAHAHSLSLASYHDIEITVDKTVPGDLSESRQICSFMGAEGDDDFSCAEVFDALIPTESSVEAALPETFGDLLKASEVECRART